MMGYSAESEQSSSHLLLSLADVALAGAHQPSKASVTNIYADHSSEWELIEEARQHQLMVEQSTMPMSPRILWTRCSDVDALMRCKLINWLLEVCMYFGMNRQTLFLSVHYIDAYISRRPDISRQHLQLLGVTSLFIAAKLEQVSPPQITAFSRLCDGACPPQLMLRMELDILDSLHWLLNVPTTVTWLDFYLHIIAAFEYVEHIVLVDIALFAQQMLDLALHTSLSFDGSYSMLAASSLMLAVLIYNNQMDDAGGAGPVDPAVVEMVSEYRWEELQTLMLRLDLLRQCPEPIVFLDPKGDGSITSSTDSCLFPFGQIFESVCISRERAFDGWCLSLNTFQSLGKEDDEEESLCMSSEDQHDEHSEASNSDEKAAVHVLERAAAVNSRVMVYLMETIRSSNSQ